ncbi:MAG: hypothetical protein IJ649_09855 [Oscillospiraceae bacterium]|nr:hypothetical protein [Oscillospiraceae bacterium]
MSDKNKPTEQSAPEITEGVEQSAPVEGEKMVTIRLPILKENNAPVFVRVNHRTWGIPRGVPVEVPECVVEVLNNSETAQMEALAFQKANEKEG